MKTLFLDIENLARPEHIFHPGKRSKFGGRANGFCADLAYILVFGYRWGGEDKSHSIQAPKRLFKKNPIGDQYILQDIADVMNQADQIVTWYGSGHDYGFIISRLAQAGIYIDPNIRHIDLCKVAGSKLRLKSNALNNVAKFFGTELKDETDHKWWPDTWAGNYDSLMKMADYCRQDVDVLYQVWEKMVPLAPLNINVPETTLDTNSMCPKCGNKSLVSRGHRVTVSKKYRRLNCSKCGSWFTGKKVD